MGFDMKEWLVDQNITEGECLVSDISGIARGKILPVTKFISAQQSGGLRLPEYVFGQSVTGEYYDSEVLDEIGRDVILRPDISTCRLGPWKRRRALGNRRTHARAPAICFARPGHARRPSSALWC